MGEGVLHMELNRPDQRNAFSTALFTEVGEAFRMIARDKDCRAVVLSGAGKIFTAGLDLQEQMQGGTFQQGDEEDTARFALRLGDHVKWLQDQFTAAELCPQPIIAAAHSAVVGAGIDLMCCCDIRYCTQDAWFTIKEVDVGLAADLGTLQRFPKIVGNESFARELAYTARRMEADEAFKHGFVSKVCPTRDAMIEDALRLASQIAEKSPMAVTGTKRSMMFSRDHSIADGLSHIAEWNGSALHTEDMQTAVMAFMSKSKPTFSKL